jgi:signal transduction histidine kinase
MVVPSPLAPAMAQTSEIAEKFGVVSWGGVPIVVQGRAIGVLAAYSCSSQRYQQSDLDLLQALAAQAGIAIEQARLHQSVMHEKAKLEAIVESLHEGLVLVDAHGRIAYASRRFVDLVGLDVQSHPQPTIDLVWRWLTRSAVDPAEARARITELDTRPSVEITLPLSRPSLRELGIQSLTVRADGLPVGRGYLLRDVTRQAEVERVKASILATVSHELRTPLAAIKGFASALLHDDMQWDHASQRDFLTQIDSEADRLAGLVRNLLDMSRLEAGTLPFEWEPCDLAELVQDTLSRSAPFVADHALRVVVEARETRCLVDRQLLERVIWNLVDNAAKYSPAGSPITIRITRDAGSILLDVADQGIGIAPEDRERIFERFVRGTGATRTGGCGLGLAICRSIVSMHGGNIAARSEPGGGSVFTVRLPDQLHAGATA